jgi:hypothetical protein
MGGDYTGLSAPQRCGEQFKYVGGSFNMADAVSGTVKNHGLGNIGTISIPKNGYIFVYWS